MKLFAKIGRYILMVILFFILLLNIVNMVQVISGNEMPMLLGYGKAVVITGSMEPVIEPGDMVIFREQTTYVNDDIVLFKANSYITHRIVETTENGFITQGDANNTIDDEILKEQIVGKVVLIIPKVGYVADFLKSPFGIFVLVIGLLAMIELPNLFRKISRRR